MSLADISPHKSSRTIGGAMKLIQAIAPITVTNSVVFSNIPQTFNHLYAKVIGRSLYNGGAKDVINLQLNGDTGANYCEQRTEGAASTQTATIYTSANQIYLGAMNYAGDTAGYGTIIEIEIPYYTNRIFYKNVISIMGCNALQDVNNSCYASLNPITSMNIYSNNSSNFVLGSQFFLYGIT